MWLSCQIWKWKRQDAEFKHKLKTTMSSVFDISMDDTINAIVSGLKEVVLIGQKRIIPVLNTLVKPSAQEKAIRGTFFRINVLCSSQTRLNNSKDFNAVANNCRTLFELLLDLKLLSDVNSTNKDVEKFHTFPKVSRIRSAQKLADFRGKNPVVMQNMVFDNTRIQAFLAETDWCHLKIQMSSLWGIKKMGNR